MNANLDAYLRKIIHRLDQIASLGEKILNEKNGCAVPMTAEETTKALAQESPSTLELTERELTEIKHALFYYAECNHGTVGHNMLVIIAKLAMNRGFRIVEGDGYELVCPDEGLTIVSR